MSDTDELNATYEEIDASLAEDWERINAHSVAETGQTIDERHDAFTEQLQERNRQWQIDNNVDVHLTITARQASKE